MDGSTVSPSAPDLRRHRFTAQDVARMVEAGILGADSRVELIGGELIEMSPQGPLHWRAQHALVNWIMRRLPETLELAANGPFRLGEDDEPEPDIFIVPARTDINAVRGADVLLVIEIADSSLDKDRLVKAPLYAAHGVREYWIVDLESRVTLVHRLANAGYGEPTKVAFNGETMVPGIDEVLTLSSLI